MSLEKLLRKRLQINTKKYFLADMFFNSRRPQRAALVKLRRTVDREITLNMKIADVASISSKLEHGREAHTILGRLHDASGKLVTVLREERRLLKEVEAKKQWCNGRLVDKKKMGKAGKYFFDLMEREKRIEGVFIRNVSGAARLAKDRVLLEGVTLIKEYFGVYKKFIDSVGNKAAMNRHSRHLLKVADKLKQSEIYNYIKNDIDIVHKKVLYVLENPKKSRIAYLLAGAYVFTPGSTEIITGLLVIRYTTKYTLNKAKKLRKRKRSLTRRVSSQ